MVKLHHLYQTSPNSHIAALSEVIEDSHKACRSKRSTEWCVYYQQHHGVMNHVISSCAPQTSDVVCSLLPIITNPPPPFDCSLTNPCPSSLLIKPIHVPKKRSGHASLSAVCPCFFCSIVPYVVASCFMRNMRTCSPSQIPHLPPCKHMPQQAPHAAHPDLSYLHSLQHFPTLLNRMSTVH